MADLIEIQAVNFMKKEETLMAQMTIFAEKADKLATAMIENEDDLLDAEERFQRLLSDMQSFHEHFFRKDLTSEHTGIPGTGFPHLESYEAAVA